MSDNDQSNVVPPFAEPASQHDLALKYKQQRDALLAFIETAPVASGICCCGDDMERHSNPMDCGHSPVDQWDYSVMGWRKQIEKFDNLVADQSA